jgi:predicted permease
VLVFGLAPALHCTRVDLVDAIKRGRAEAARLGRKLNPRGMLVIAQVALSLLLLTAAGLLVRTFLYSMRVDLGFERRDLLVADVSPPYGGPRERTFYRELLERVRAMPGVVDVTLARRAPLSGSEGGMARDVTIPGQPMADPQRVLYTVVDLNYFHTLGIRLLRGRDFDPHDGPGAQPAVIVNDAMARRFWAGADALGKTVALADEHGRECTIVGVVNDSHVNSIQEKARPYLYLPYAQTNFDDMHLIAATRSEPLLQARQLRAEVSAIDKRVPVLEVTSMRLLVRSRLYQQQVCATVVGFLGAIGLLLAAVGLYGLISYFVTERTREIGIRMALGARPRDAMGMVLRQGIGLVLAGAGLGLLGAIFATRLLRSLVYGVSLRDPITFAAVVVLLVAVAALASYFPARRATRIQPTTALHYE